jgi:hypothetical protein
MRARRATLPGTTPWRCAVESPPRTPEPPPARPDTALVLGDSDLTERRPDTAVGARLKPWSGGAARVPERALAVPGARDGADGGRAGRGREGSAAWAPGLSGYPGIQPPFSCQGACSGYGGDRVC